MEHILQVQTLHDDRIKVEDDAVVELQVVTQAGTLVKIAVQDGNLHAVEMRAPQANA